ncbi:hypothetical protein [Saccharopolyspora hordei]|uniref:Uncharacterized protein n=1 Tax=Saccharopolyspora hordei TaxID=1838 RepID=A0A853ACJ2_9PSEU|nr:hypothetical protein [Saccharopolyspora hordei]NYI82172.1 hypothetical protein [Saccharopolyspora hordei]
MGRGRPNPLIRPKARGRALSTGLVGLAITAGTLLGAGTAHAEALVVDTPLAVVEAAPGQQVAVAPSTLDLKVREAVLLTMPLNFGRAAEAAERFKQLDPIPIGVASEERTFYSGKDIAEAAASRLTELGLPEDKVDTVRWHFTNLVSLGNAVTVRVDEPEEEKPPAPPSSEDPAPPSQEPPQQQPAPGTPPPPPSQDAPVPDPQTSLPQPGGAPAAVSVLPPDLRGSALAWSQGYLGQAPGVTPDVDELVARTREQQEAREQQDEVRAAGSAEALPTEVTERVAGPVLLASVALAVATAGLVRTWVLRRQ